MHRRGIIYIQDDAVYDKDSFDIPENYKPYLESVVIPDGLLRDRTKALARDIYTDNKDKELLLICILKGGFYFYNQVCENLTELGYKYFFEFVKVKSYSGTSSTGSLEISGLNFDKLKGKDVLIVEDLIDTGITMTKLIPYLKDAGANSVQVAVLAEKRTKLSCGFQADYCGFSIPDKFIVGSGFDYNEHFRSMKHVCAINQHGIDTFRE